MLPTITGFYAGIAALIIIFLTINVVRQRMIAKVGIGYGNSEALHVAIRIHGNAIEYIPFTFLLMALIEIQDGLAPLWLHILGIVFILARIMHIMGLRQSSGTTIGRRHGIVFTLLVILILAVTNIVLFFGL
jgi:uncharacterized membrane protein YecN with MAPEG domain